MKGTYRTGTVVGSAAAYGARSNTASGLNVSRDSRCHRVCLLPPIPDFPGAGFAHPLRTFQVVCPRFSILSSPSLGARILPVGEIREHVLLAVGSRTYLICET
uniref:(northern house mosquito) hypothetical protein n=1 Tax=Culex pipiens TaxID=7175 RepID=A0A8D8DL42_CULPI